MLCIFLRYGLSLLTARLVLVVSHHTNSRIRSVLPVPELPAQTMQLPSCRVSLTQV